MYHNILIVDDEAHVTEALETLLKTQTDIDCEVYVASSAAQALDIARSERIDLMVSDIYMPDMSGLELLREMRKLWPICQTIMLTGHADFQNAYEAFQLKAAGFLLKTEDDEHILKKIREVLEKSAVMLKQKSLLVDEKMPPIESLDKFLQADDSRRSRYLTRIQIDVSRPMILCLCSAQESQVAAIDTLIRHYMESRVSVIRAMCSSAHACVLWLFQDAASDVTPTLISNMLETVNNSYQATTRENFSCVIAQAHLDSFSRILDELKSSQADSSDRQGSVAVLNPLQHKSSEYAIRFVKQYIKEHISEDITISMLASVTGYNADYLARTFRSQTGLTIGQYIINVRMQRIKTLMLDDNLSLDDIAQQTGFSSRAYFNRFIKRIAEVSPRMLRLSVQNESASTPPQKNNAP